MKKSTLLVASALFATMILSGCGGSADQPTPEPAPATEAAPQPTEIPATEEAATEAPATEEVVVEAPATDEAAAAISYAAQIQPIFDNKCIKCHGVDSVKEGLDMRTYDALMAGSHNGAVIVPGDADRERQNAQARTKTNRRRNPTDHWLGDPRRTEQLIPK